MQQLLKEKTDTKKHWDILIDDESKERYKKAMKKTKSTVAEVENESLQELYEHLELKEEVSKVL